MAGKRGMKRKSDTSTVRRNIWRSIRIHKKFNVPDIQRSVPNSTYNNVCKYISLLLKHGYISKVQGFRAGHIGQFQTYRLERNPGPEHPNRCDRCGEPLTSACLFEKQQKEKETKKETKEVTDDHNRPDAITA